MLLASHSCDQVLLGIGSRQRSKEVFGGSNRQRLSGVVFHLEWCSRFNCDLEYVFDCFTLILVFGNGYCVSSMVVFHLFFGLVNGDLINP